MFQGDNNITNNLSPMALNQPRGLSSKMALLDVFAFVPVPVFSPGKRSSKRSSCASIFLFLTMIIYVITTLKSFLVNNIPRTSEQQESIEDTNFTMPYIALTVIPNMNIGVSLVDQTIYGVNISQGILYKGLHKPRTESLLGTDYNCKPSWLPGMNFTSFLCPQKLGVLEGNLFTSEQFQYIRIDFYTCKNIPGSDIICKDTDTIRSILKTARLFLFIEQDSTFYNSVINDFKALFYFPVFSLIQRYEIYLKNEEITTSPDYFYSFNTQTKQALFYEREKTYTGELIPGQENTLITIWLRLNEESTVSKLAPTTFFEILGKWGALWSVFLTTFGLYFWRHNKRKFYDRNPQWENFGNSIGVPKKENVSNTSLELPTMTQEK